MTYFSHNEGIKGSGGINMKKIVKIVGISLVSLIVLLMSVAFLFGSTKHANLKGSEEQKINEFMEQFSKDDEFDGSVLVLHKGKEIFNKSYGFAVWN